MFKEKGSKGKKGDNESKN